LNSYAKRNRLALRPSTNEKKELVTDKNKDKKRLKELDAENLRLQKFILNYNSHSLDEVTEPLGHWYKSYNFDRPHSSLKYKTPAAFENLDQNLYFEVAPLNEM
jgi:transposase InsO family protein